MTAPSSLELGQSTVAKELVPGEVSTINGHVEVLRSQAERFDGAAETVRGITAPSFEGLAAVSFEARRDQLPPRWSALADNLDTMRSSLTTYASALTSAQQGAQEAIDKWEAGEEATRQAVREHNSAVETFNTQQTKPDADPFAAPPIFSDPGQAMRDEAEQILEDARERLADAGDSASQEVGRLPGARSEGESGDATEGDTTDPSITIDGGSQDYGTDLAPSDSDADGTLDDDDNDDDNDGVPDTEDPETWRDKVSVDVVGAEGQYGVGASGRVEDQYGPVTGYAEGEVFAGAKGDVGAGFDGNGVQAHASGSLGVGAEGSVGAEWGYAEVGASGEVFAGAEASGDASVGLDGVHASGEAFAGAKAEGSISGDIGGVGAEGTAEGWAGVGISGDADIGYDDGEITIGLSGGAALGLGGKLGGEFTIDVPEIADTVGDAAGAVEDFAGDVGDKVDDIVPDIDVPW